MDLSVATWIEKGGAKKGDCSEMTKLLTWTFRLEFCRQYYKQQKRWPVLKLHTQAYTILIRNYTNNT